MFWLANVADHASSYETQSTALPYYLNLYFIRHNPPTRGGLKRYYATDECATVDCATGATAPSSSFPPSSGLLGGGRREKDTGTPVVRSTACRIVRPPVGRLRWRATGEDGPEFPLHHTRESP
eukprot:1188776-Prorocentrum_minimum.AAC.3